MVIVKGLQGYQVGMLEYGLSSHEFVHKIGIDLMVFFKMCGHDRVQRKLFDSPKLADFTAKLGGFCPSHAQWVIKCSWESF